MAICNGGQRTVSGSRDCLGSCLGSGWCLMSAAEDLSLTTMEHATLLACEDTIRRGLQTFYEVGAALMTISEARLYRADFPTFDTYCRERWHMSRPRAYQLMQASDVVNNLSTIVDILPTREAQVRPLTKLPPEAQAPTWREAVKHAGGIPSAAVVGRVANRSGSHRSDSRLEDMPKPERWRILTGKRVILEQALQLLAFDLDDPVPVAINADDAEGAAYEVLESSLVERLARRLVQE